MSIKIVTKDELEEYKINAEIKKITSLEKNVVIAIKDALSHMVHEDHLFELREYIDDLLYHWKDKEIEYEEDDDDHEGYEEDD